MLPRDPLQQRKNSLCKSLLGESKSSPAQSLTPSAPLETSARFYPVNIEVKADQFYVTSISG
jgi:hypothetical protein